MLERSHPCEHGKQRHTLWNASDDRFIVICVAAVFHDGCLSVIESKYVNVGISALDTIDLGHLTHQ